MAAISVQRAVTFAYLFARHRYGYSPIVLMTALFRPLIDLALVYWIFGRIIGIPVGEYLVYLVCGLLPWIFFRRSIISATSTFIVEKRSILNIGLPPLALPIAAATLEFGKFLFGFGAMLAVLLVSVRLPDSIYLLLPVALLPLIIATYAFSVAAAYFAVVKRGVSYFLPFFFFVSFWLTPVMYHWSLLPDWLQPVVRYNPLTMLISGPQVILHGRTVPTLELFVVSYAVAAGAVIVAWLLHRRLGPELAARL